MISANLSLSIAMTLEMGEGACIYGLCSLLKPMEAILNLLLLW